MNSPVIKTNPSAYLDHPKQFGIFVIGKSGTGKHYQTSALLLDQLAEGKTVIVLDLGRSYIKLAQTIGGTCIHLQQEGTYEALRYGDASLFVYEFDELGCQQWDGGLPLLPASGVDEDCFFLIDETWSVIKTFPLIVPAMTSMVKSGASFCITGQSDDDVQPFRSLPLRSLSIRLTRDPAPQ